MNNIELQNTHNRSEMLLRENHQQTLNEFEQRLPQYSGISDSYRVVKATSMTKDPLNLIDDLLSQYVSDQKKKATDMTDVIKTKAEAIKDINRLWSQLMTKYIGNTDPSKNDKTVNLSAEKDNSGYLKQLDDIIKKALKDNKGFKEITGDIDISKVNYNQLQTMNTTMTAYCDRIQVDLDNQNQKFKNVMTLITSAQEEIRDVRRAIVSFSQGQ